MKMCAALALIGLYLTGCANPSKKFYSVVKFEKPNEGKITLMPSSTLKEAILDKTKEGYVLIGHSDFLTSKQPSEHEIKSWGKKMGATLVIYSVEYVGTETEIRNVAVANPPQVSHSYTSGSVYGSSGDSMFFSGTTTTTTSGGYSTYTVPYSVRMFAVYEGYLISTNKEQPMVNLPSWYPH